MELGMGLHGEPGIRRGRMLTADEAAAEMLAGILEDFPMEEHDEAAVIVNGLGATPLSELLIVFRAVHKLLSDKGISICRCYVGNFATSLEMAGCSISLLHLNPLLKRLILAPAETPALVQC